MVQRKVNLLFNGSAILYIGILLSVLLGFYIHKSEVNRSNLRFQFEIEQVRKQLQYRIERYEGALIQTRAFFASSEHVSQAEFKEYFNRIRVSEHLPGLKSMGYILKVKAEDLTSHMREMRMLKPDYEIKPHLPRDIYYPVIYLEPENEKSLTAIGFDAHSESTRREAVSKAMDTGLPVRTGKTILVQNLGSNNHSSFILYVPYFKKDIASHTVESRRQNLVGFITGSFETQELFNAIYSDLFTDIGFKIFDGDKMSMDNLIFETGPNIVHLKDFEKDSIKKLSLLNREITFQFFPTSDFFQGAQTPIPWIVSLTGMLITLLIFRIIRITKKQAEESETSSRALFELLKTRDNFISIVSHELKTPLTSLKLQAQMIKRSMNKGEKDAFSEKKLNALIDQTNLQTKRLERLVDDMLDMSRIRTGKLSIHKEDFDLCELVIDVIELMTEQFSHIPGKRPILKLPEKCIVHWDKFRIEQVITNLLTNAIKYGESKEIEVEIEDLGDRIIFSVKDNGLGVPDEFREKIFERFERAGVSHNNISGLGLGLYIANQVIKSHSGKIWVENAKGKGSVFKVEIPREIKVQEELSLR